MGELPNWVYDVVMNLLDEEDAHAKYMVEVYSMAEGKHVLKQHDWCPAAPLALVPDDVKAHAVTMTRYREQQGCIPDLAGYFRVQTPGGERVAYFPPDTQLPEGWTYLGPYAQEACDG